MIVASLYTCVSKIPLITATEGRNMTKCSPAVASGQEKNGQMDISRKTRVLGVLGVSKKPVVRGILK